jgi:DNA-binding transcriptional ArsR family regulator
VQKSPQATVTVRDLENVLRKGIYFETSMMVESSYGFISTEDAAMPHPPMQKQDALAALAALAHETRLDVFRLLVTAGPDGLAAGEIAERLGVQAATLSHHLKELKTARVVHCRREGRSLIYSPDFVAMADLVGFLSENCCQAGGCATGLEAACTTLDR